MKKLFLLATLAIGSSTIPAFADGYAFFSGPPRGVWDAFSQVDPKPGGNVNVGFLWGTGTPLVDSITTSVPTNGFPPFNVNAAWTDILTDPNFQVAINSNTAAPVVATVQSVNGAWGYNASGTFPVVGTVPGIYTVFAIGWDKTYATPAQAAAAGAAVGWSAPFGYTFTTVIGLPITFQASGMIPFGVVGVPEPGILSFAGLGAGALWLRRRRKRS